MSIPSSEGIDDRETTLIEDQRLKVEYGNHFICSKTFSNICSFSCFLLDNAKTFLAQN